MPDSGGRPRLKALLLEDDDLDAELTGEALAKAFEPEIERVAARAPFEAAVQRGGFQVILADFSLPAFNGVEALEFAREHAPDIPFIFVSGVLGEEFATEALKEGATDYVVKQRLGRLPRVVLRALEEAETRRERRRAEQQLALLVAELSHRVKNTLAIVGSVAKMTLAKSASLAEFEESFMGRLRALSETHALLLRGDYRAADLLHLAERTFAPFACADRLQYSGPPVELPPQPALALGMLLHELAANAALHGALSVAEGKAELTWSREGPAEGPLLRLSWRERGGPRVAAPTRSGFGTLLIKQSARYELDGEAELRFDPAGLECEVVVPMSWRLG